MNQRLYNPGSSHQHQEDQYGFWAEDPNPGLKIPALDRPRVRGSGRELRASKRKELQAALLEVRGHTEVGHLYPFFPRVKKREIEEKLEPNFLII